MVGAERQVTTFDAEGGSVFGDIANSEKLLGLARQHHIHVIHIGLHFQAGHPDPNRVREALDYVMPYLK